MLHTCSQTTQINSGSELKKQKKCRKAWVSRGGGCSYRVPLKVSEDKLSCDHQTDSNITEPEGVPDRGVLQSQFTW